MRSRGLLQFTAVIAAIVAAGWIAWRDRDDRSGGGSPRTVTRPPARGSLRDALRGKTASTPATEAKPDETAQRSADEIAATLSAKTSRRIYGRVVDARRFGVAGARVRLLAAGRETVEVVSSADGAFEFAFASVKPGRLLGALLATGPDGAIGDGRAVLIADRDDGRYDDDHPRDFDAGALAILPPARLIVRVRDEGGPVTGAEVTANVSSEAWVSIPALLPVVVTGPDGVAVLPAPRCDAMVIATVPRRAATRAWARCESGVEQTIDLLLHPSCTATIRVRDTVTNGPVANAHVELGEKTVERQSRMFSYIGPEPSFSRGLLPDLICDANGVAYFEDFDPERQFSLTAKAPGYETNDRSRAKLDASSRDVELRLAPRAANEVRRPIVADEAPIPPDGSVIPLRDPGIALDIDLPYLARIEGEELVIADQPEGYRHAIAVAPDGSMAEFGFGLASRDVGPLRFKKPRTLELRLHCADGRAAPGARIEIGYGNPNVELRADDQGRAVGRGLLAKSVTIAAAHTYAVAMPLAVVDLSRADASIDVVVPERFEAILAVTIDGQPSLPPTFQVGSADFRWKVEAEDPQRGEVRVSALAGAKESTIRASFDAAPFLPVDLVVPVVHDDAPPVVPVALRHGATLRLDVKRAAKQQFGLWIQRQGENGVFTSLENQFRAIDRFNGSGGLFEFGPLEAGTWRVLDSVTSLASAPVALQLGETRVASLDLSSAIVIHGRVAAPAGTDLRQARVVALGEPAEATSNRFSQPVYPGTYVLADGTFERTIDGAKPFVRVWHPSLAPPAGDPYVEVRDPTQGVLLALVDRPSLVFTLVRSCGSIAVSDLDRSDRLAISLDREDGDHAHVTRSLATKGAASEVVPIPEIPSGRWTLFLDPGGCAAPLLRTGVEITENGVDLGSLALESGSTLRLQIADGRANRSRIVHVRARHVGVPDYSRFWSPEIASDLLLPGLGSGRFDVTLSDATGQELWTGTVECDGAHETVLSVALH